MENATVPVDGLINAVRTMRRWGFTIQQDSPGKSQGPGEQLDRAKTVAADMLGMRDQLDSKDVDLLARAILSAAAARRPPPVSLVG